MFGTKGLAVTFVSDNLVKVINTVLKSSDSRVHTQKHQNPSKNRQNPHTKLNPVSVCDASNN